jgi:hypothetical protein
MERRKREFWWLLALEATLFLSWPCWELTAPWAEPVGNAFRFAVSVLVGATVTTFACHWGPAAFAARFGGRPRRFSWVLPLWLGLGYTEWILGAAWSVAHLASPVRIAGTPGGLRNWSWLGLGVAFLAIATIAAWVKSWWKPVAAGGLFLGTGILIWALATTWNGMAAHNAYYSERPVQFDWLIIKGMLLSAAPSAVIAWRIGRIEREPNRVWLSGLAGMWLPLVLSVTVASLADQAGATLYWVPSLSRGFTWALLGPNGRWSTGVMASTTWTLLSPALVSGLSLRQLAPPWTGPRKAWLIPIMACLLIAGVISITWRYEGSYSLPFTPVHQFWAGSLVILGAAAGLASAVRRAS